MFYLVLINIGATLALLWGAVSANVDIASTALPAYATSLLYFMGLLITFHEIPKYWQWYAQINPVRYAFLGMTRN